MKFSDMMGKSDKGTVDEAEATETVAPAAGNAPPVPEAPIRFGAPRPDTADVADAAVSADASAASADTQLLDPVASEPSIVDVMKELSPRAGAPTPVDDSASGAELGATAWLEGLGAINDDLLPR